MKWKRVVGIVKKEVKELLREPISLLTFLLVPISMMVVFGYGLKLEVKKVPFAVLDLDNSKLSREIEDKFASNREYFDLKGYLTSYDKAEKLLEKGKVSLIIVFPPNFEKRVERGEKGEFQALIDGTFPYRAEVIKSYVEAISAREALKVKPNFKVEQRYWFNESLNQDYLVAVGTMAVVLLISPAVFSALLIVKEKESGSIYNAYSSPITKGEFITGKFLSGALLSTVVFFIAYFMTVFLFGVSQKGSTLLLTLGSLIYTFVAVSFGLLISNFFSSQAAAFIGTTVLTVVPSILYSGYLTPVSSMGTSGRITAHLIPTFYYLRFLKSIFFKGDPLSLIVKDLGALTLFWVVLFLATLKTFKKREE